MTFQEFEKQVIPVIVEKAKGKGYNFPSAIIAQAICESGVLRGGSTLSNKYFNLFGMKKGSYTGATVKLKTREEYKQGVLTTIYAEFRAFSSVSEGIEGYFDFIQMKRYQNLKTATSPEDYIRKLKEDGWATSSTYINTLTNILNTYNLKKYDSEVSVDTLQQDKEEVKKISKTLQEILNKYGFGLAVDGIIGDKTFAALKTFRKL